MNLKYQIRKLLMLEALWSFRLGGSLWVMFLGLRGFSLAEIGLAEGFFHLVSILGELPSGLAADLLERKRVLTASQGLFGLSAVIMLFSKGFWGVLLSMGLNALGYNLASGTREALTYDSLLQMGREGEYLPLAARQNMVYRGGDVLVTLLAGVALTLGWQICYVLDGAFSLAGLMVAANLTEPEIQSGEDNASRSFLAYVYSTIQFLRLDRKAVGLMLFNAFVGAAAILTGFYLQDALPKAGTPAALLGPLLLMKGIGGILGSRLAPCLGRWSRPLGWGLPVAAVAAGAGLAFGDGYFLMALGGFLAGMGDDALELQVEEELNRRFPSSQRATLISVSSLCFSLTMVILSPLGGFLVAS